MFYIVIAFLLVIIRLFLTSFIYILKRHEHDNIIFLSFANGLFFCSSLLFYFYFHEFILSVISVMIFLVYSFLWNKEIMKLS